MVDSLLLSMWSDEVIWETAVENARMKVVRLGSGVEQREWGGEIESGSWGRVCALCCNNKNHYFKVIAVWKCQLLLIWCFSVLSKWRSSQTHSDTTGDDVIVKQTKQKPLENSASWYLGYLNMINSLFTSYQWLF